MKKFPTVGRMAGGKNKKKNLKKYTRAVGRSQIYRRKGYKNKKKNIKKRSERACEREPSR